jgi:hypothetical protein
LHPKPDAVAEWVMRYGVGIVLVSIVLVLLFMYFWKIINSPPKYVELFKQTGDLLEKVHNAIHKNTLLLVEVKTLLRGGFRNNKDDDDYN